MYHKTYMYIHILKNIYNDINFLIYVRMHDMFLNYMYNVYRYTYINHNLMYIKNKRAITINIILYSHSRRRVMIQLCLQFKFCVNI